MSDETLPPFGVRGLCSPDQPFSVVEITEAQYDVSVRSFPDSALTWHDEDDGETVTVGSGWELRERLKDPIPTTNPMAKIQDEWTGRIRDQYIHLFDISHSQTSFDVWKEHEAYFSKSRTSMKSSPDTMSRPEEKFLDESSQLETQTVTSDESPVATGTDDTQQVTTVVDLTPSPTVPGLIEGLGSKLDHLAGFLQGTSETLRKAAEKTRETDTSPIEDVLSGMTSILGQVGAFGLDVMEKISDNISDTQTDNAISATVPTYTESTAQAPASCHRDATINYLNIVASMTKSPVVDSLGLGRETTKVCEHLLLEENLQSAVSELRELIQPNNMDRLDREKYPDLERIVLVQLLALNTLDSIEMSSRHVSGYQNEVMGEQERDRRRQALSQLVSDMYITSSVSTTSNPIPQITPDPSPTEQMPLLDQGIDAVDAGFSVRYPPVTSLRRAETIGGLPFVTGNGRSPLRNRRAREMYGKQPCPQVFDAETLRRSHYAKACFPAQEYTPGSAPTSKAYHNPKNTASTPIENIDLAPNTSNETTNIHIRDFLDESSLPQINTFSEQITNPSQINKSTTSISELQTDSTEAVPQMLQSTQIEVADDILAQPVATLNEDGLTTTHHSSGHGQFSQLDSTFTSPLGQSDHHRLQRHRSLMNPALRRSSAGGLGRSHSLTATNPAARLNRPFSPLFPALVTPPSLTDQEQQMKTTGGPVRGVHRSFSDRQSRSPYESHRSSNAHRAFEPVWEDQTLGKKTSRDPGVVILDASNFSPGTTEQDIRDLLADDCRTVIGINTLISCRIVATDPEVVAKLVIKDKTNADSIIDKYNKKWVNGRPLTFEYSKSGIDARINRLRGAFVAPKPRHLQSVPDLRQASLPRPPFPSFVSQARPIVPPQPATKPSLPPTPLPSQPVEPPPFAPNLIEECASQLKAMGYGLLDPAMLSRLHVYASAASGDIHEAIEMIEEDMKANDLNGSTMQDTVRRTSHEGNEPENQIDTNDADAFDEVLERTLKLSREER